MSDKPSERQVCKFRCVMRFLPVALALALGTAMSMSVFRTDRDWAQRQIEADFAVAAHNRSATVEEAIEENGHILSAIRNFFLVSGNATAAEFRDMVAPFCSNMFGVQAVGWIPRVPMADRARYEEAARKDGEADFRFTERDKHGKFVPANERNEYFPAYFVEPLHGNEPVVGFDLGSDPARLKAIHEARDSGRAVATGRITLVPETVRRTGFLMFLPIYAKGSPVDTVEHRRENLQGFIAGVFRAGDLVEQALSHDESVGVDIHLIDGSAPVGQRLLYCPPLCEHRLAGEPMTDYGSSDSPGLHHLAKIVVGSRSWTVLATPTEAYIASRQSRQPWNLLAAGLMITVLGSGFIAASIERNTRIQCQVEQRTRELGKSEARYRQIFEAVGDELLVLDREGRIVTANSTACTNHGYALDELRGMPCSNLVHPDYRKEFTERIARLKPGEIVRAESVALRKDGSSFRVAAHASLILIEGEPYLLAGARDITKRQLVEEALQDREKRLSDIIANAAEIIYTLSLDGVFTFVSPAWTAKLGHNVDEVVGRNFAEFLHPESVPDYVQLLRVLRKAGKIRGGVEYQVRHKNGTWRWHRTTGSILRDSQGNAVGYVGVAEDITEQVLAKEALQERERQLRDIIESASETIYTISPEGVFTFVSSAWTQNLGHAVSDVLGHNFTEFIHPDDMPRCVYLLSHTRTTGKPRETAEYRVRHKDGAWRWHRTNGSVLRDSRGNATGYVGVAEDITARKETELRLAEAKQAAEEASHAKSRFLNNMSREIRAPLTAILGYSDVLLTTLSQADNRQAAVIIKRNGEHLLAVINNILDLSRIETGRFDMARVACSPFQVLDEVESLIGASAAAKKLPLLFQCNGLLPERITSDPIRLRQILTNLVDNALKFTQTGSVQVVARLVDETTADPKLQIDVIDTGVGMSEPQVERLFQPFAQPDDSIMHHFGGTGLGLIISRRLAVALGGDIKVSSVPGKGSSFSLTVATGPLEGIERIERPKLPASVPDRIDSPNPALVRLNCRILLAEDSSDNQRLISFLLRTAGAEVTAVDDGRDAVTQVLAAQRASENAESGSARPFDVVLMDIQMPVMNGLEATRYLRKHGYNGPILALTAFAMPQDIEECLLAGCNAHLCQPIDRDTLLRTIGQFLKPSAVYLVDQIQNDELLLIDV